MYPRIYTFSILQTLVIPRYPIMNISYLIFSLSLSFYDFRNIENIIRLNHRTRKSKKKITDSTNENSYSIFNAHPLQIISI